MATFLGSDDSVACKVVVNQEGQYSIWPEEGTPPVGWTEEGFRGTRRDCLAHIDGVWKDMRPKGLREATR